MATPTNTSPAKPPAAKAAEPTTTKRLVLKREQVILVPDGATPEQIAAALKALGVKARVSHEAQAWTVVVEQEGGTMDAAILAHTGPAGHPDSKVGVFKAPTVRSWAGGLEIVAPPKPLVQKRAID